MAAWEAVPLREDSSLLPPVAGVGLKTLIIPGNNSLALINGTSTMAQSVSPYMVEFGRAGCADEDGKASEQQQPGETTVQPWIGFNIYNPVMNTWKGVDLMNSTTPLGFNATAVLGVGNWLSPTVAVDNVNFTWYIILQSTVPLRQVILRKDLKTLTSFMDPLDLTKSPSTLFPTQLLYEGWTVASVLNENAPFVGRGVATMVRDQLIIISGTANSFTPGDAQLGQLRGCDHAYVFSTTKSIWMRQALTVADGSAFPDTREKAAFLAVGNKIYMHGGVKPFQTVLGDLWVLDTDSWIWTRAVDGPGPRADHTLLQYHEYLLAVSGFDKGRNVPMTSVLPIMAYNTNMTSWTDQIRATLDKETNFVTNMTRAAIIIGTITFAMVLLVLALSTHFLRKWNQRNYTKVHENFELDEQRRKAAQSLPSILKKKYISQDGGKHNSKHGTGLNSSTESRGEGLHTEVIFEDVEGESELDDGYDEDDSDCGRDDEGEQRVQRVSLLSRSQFNPTSQLPRRVRIEEHMDQRGDSLDHPRMRRTDEEADEEDDEEGQVIVRMPPELSKVED
ncbi:hypothetical protein EDD11_001344 [Mortierella claussenii]|nr:hypothetical protein EDD11_001344 [Mortierella claussenii]